MSYESLIEPETSGNADNGADKKSASARRTLLTDKCRAFARDYQARQSLLSTTFPSPLEPNLLAKLASPCDSGYSSAKPSPPSRNCTATPDSYSDDFLDFFSDDDEGKASKANSPTGSRVELPLLHESVLLNWDTCQDGVSETLTQVGHIKV